MTADPEPDYVKTVCPDCQRDVVKVRDRASGEWVVLQGRDDGGAWYAVKVRGRWRVTLYEVGEEPPADARRYRGHDCPVMAEAAARVQLAMSSAVVKAADVVSGTTVGPCAGRCGAETERYGPAAEVLCLDCAYVLELWRKSPGPWRGPIPYGRRVGGEYVWADGVAPRRTFP